MTRAQDNGTHDSGNNGRCAGMGESSRPLGSHEDAAQAVPSGKPPNVVIVLTDDQGYGDLGCHGNSLIKTPNLDRLHDESVRFTHFYVSPVCSPTRASLMTGRYNYRTGVVDTYLGRSMMHPDEVTLAELLCTQGYRTGLFGKWHLGDNYPMRAMDKGFQESLVHNGGGIGQPSDPPGNRYFDPILKHNGIEEKHTGYCTDIFTDAAIAFIEEKHAEPFFVYLSTNAPHSPLEVSEKHSAPYLAMGLDEDTARVYGMVTNIDKNVGCLLQRLDDLRLQEETIVIFLTDNGPSWSEGLERYNAGLRGQKGAVYEGGIRVPCFVRWPARLPAGKDIDHVAAHIDILPTILEACGLAVPSGIQLDGVSLLPLVLRPETKWRDRVVYFQWHRGDAPQPYRNCAARSQRYKLVNGNELYDIYADPGEACNIVGEHPDIVARMRSDYERWLNDVGSAHGYEPPRIYLGTPHEQPVTLTRQDWRGTTGWEDPKMGYWEVKVATPGDYEVRLRFSCSGAGETAHLRLGAVALQQAVVTDATSCIFKGVRLSAGDARLEAWLTKNERARGAQYVDVSKAGLSLGAPLHPSKKKGLPRRRR